MSNKGHTFRKVTKTNIQEHFIFFDCEAYIKKISKTEQHQSLRLGWAKYWDRSLNKTKSHYFIDSISLWDFVEDCFIPMYNKCMKREIKTIYMYAHNVDYDFKIADGFNEMIIKRKWEVENIYISGTVFILVLKKGEKKIYILDTMNYVSCSLEKLGESIGFKKMSVPNFENVETDYLSSYCKNDVEVIYNFIKLLIEFLNINDLGSLKNTAGSLALNILKYRFYKSYTDEIYIHSDEAITKIEREAYKGGITDCFKIGRYKQKLYKLDINSMYPYIMKEKLLPVKKIDVLHGINLETLKKVMKTKYVIAKMKISLPTEYSYILHSITLNNSSKSVFLHGEFEATLCSPEIEFVMKYGKIKEISDVIVYDMGDVFNSFIDFFYNKRLQYKKEKNHAFDLFTKIIMNSCYGKFGQKSTEYVKQEKPIETNTIFKANINGINVLQVGHVVYHLIKSDDSVYETFVPISAFITSFARMYLVEMILKAGRKNVFYVDTDCLIVNEKGHLNLKKYIHNSKLGCLKLEDVSNDSVFYRPKFYYFGNDFKCKGVKKDANLCSNIVDDGNMYVKQNQFERFKTSLSRKSLDFIRVSEVKKIISKCYDKGFVKEGVVYPYSLDDINYVNGLKKGIKEFDKYSSQTIMEDPQYFDSPLKIGENEDNYGNIRL